MKSDHRGGSSPIRISKLYQDSYSRDKEVRPQKILHVRWYTVVPVQQIFRPRGPPVRRPRYCHRPIHHSVKLTTKQSIHVDGSLACFVEPGSTLSTAAFADMEIIEYVSQVLMARTTAGVLLLYHVG